MILVYTGISLIDWMNIKMIDELYTTIAFAVLIILVGILTLRNTNDIREINKKPQVYHSLREDERLFTVEEFEQMSQVLFNNHPDRAQAVEDLIVFFHNREHHGTK
jgi:hypothetical protein